MPFLVLKKIPARSLAANLPLKNDGKGRGSGFLLAFGIMTFLPADSEGGQNIYLWHFFGFFLGLPVGIFFGIWNWSWHFLVFFAKCLKNAKRMLKKCQMVKNAKKMLKKCQKTPNKCRKLPNAKKMPNKC